MKNQGLGFREKHSKPRLDLQFNISDETLPEVQAILERRTAYDI